MSDNRNRDVYIVMVVGFVIFGLFASILVGGRSSVSQNDEAIEQTVDARVEQALAEQGLAATIEAQNTAIMTEVARMMATFSSGEAQAGEGEATREVPITTLPVITGTSAADSPTQAPIETASPTFTATMVTPSATPSQTVMPDPTIEPTIEPTLDATPEPTIAPTNEAFAPDPQIVPVLSRVLPLPLEAPLAWLNDSVAALRWDGRIVVQEINGDTGGFTVAQTLPEDYPAQALAWSADGQLASAGQDGRVFIWDLAIGEPAASIEAHSEPVIALAWAPGEPYLASLSAQSLRIWDTESLTLLATYEAGDATLSGMAWMPGRLRLVISAGSFAEVLTWIDMGISDNYSTLRLNQSEALSAAISWSADGNQIAAARDASNTIALWRAPNSPASSLNGHEDRIAALSWSPAAPILASASADTTVRLWDSAGSPLQVLQHDSPVSSLSWSPDGRYLATLAGTIYIWDLAGE